MNLGHLNLIVIGFLLFHSYAWSQNSYPFQKKLPKVEYSPDELDREAILKRRQESDHQIALYNKVFPYHMSVCAGSIWQKRNEGTGGTYGHTFMILRGACLKKNKHGKPLFPHQLEFCEGGDVGISTDYVFTNIQWLGSEGRDFMLYGNHPADQPFDRKAWRRVQSEAMKRGVLDHVKYTTQAENGYKDLSKKLGRHDADFRRDWAYDEAIGTDIAIGVARGGMNCTRIPLVGTDPTNNSQLVRDVIAELNQLNQMAKVFGYDYDGVVNNCSTTAHNALAKIGYWDRTHTHGHPSNLVQLLKRLDDITSPFNEMFYAYKMGNDLHVLDLVQILRKYPERFSYFKKVGWVPLQFGTLIEEVQPVHYKNEIFNTSNRTHYLSLAHVIWENIGQHLLFSQPQGAGADFKELTADPDGIAVDLSSNVEYWKEKIKIILKTLRSEEEQDEVVQFLIQHFEEKYAQAWILHLQLITHKVGTDHVQSLGLPAL